MNPQRCPRASILAAFISLLPPLQVLGQTLSIGVVAGGSVTSAFKDQVFPNQQIPCYTSPFLGVRYFSPSKDYLVGGVVELHFNRYWSVEANGLFRKLHMTSAAVMPDGSLNSVSPSPVITWEFPLLAKHSLERSIANPFIEAGPSFRTAGNLNGTEPSHIGITGGVGVDIGWHGMRISPAVRYTRWVPDKNRGFTAQTDSNQVELLVGLSREAESKWHPAGNRLFLGLILGTNITGDYRMTTQSLGGPAGSPVNIIGASGPRKLTIGPILELQLRDNISVEVDALYRPISSQGTNIYLDRTPTSSTGSYVTWEFPVLAKYRFRIRGLKPFVGAGPSFRLPQSLTGASAYGVVAAIGLMLHVRGLKFSPSVRYTHWAPDQPYVFGGAVRNQTVAAVGFSF